MQADCPHCDGSGVDPEDTTQPCPACEGTGKDPDDADENE